MNLFNYTRRESSEVQIGCTPLGGDNPIRVQSMTTTATTDTEGSVEQAGNISVVYTKEKQTADAYIERTSRELAREHFVRVATSDAVEQMIILGGGAYRISAREFYDEVSLTDAEIQNFLS